MLKIITVEVTPFAANAIFLFCSEGRKAALVDPGGEVERLLEVLKDNSLTLEQVWITHSHLDHCGGVAGIKRARPCVFYAHRAEAHLRAHVSEMCQMFGVPEGLMENCPEPDQYFEPKQILKVGEYEFEVQFSPGHSPGGVCFYCQSEKLMLTGDTLISGSVGRTDLPGGSLRLLKESLSNVIMPLPPETKIISGHGPESTMAEEFRSNPFLGGAL